MGVSGKSQINNRAGQRHQESNKLRRNVTPTRQKESGPRKNNGAPTSQNESNPHHHNSTPTRQKDENALRNSATNTRTWREKMDAMQVGIGTYRSQSHSDAYWGVRYPNPSYYKFTSDMNSP